MSHYSDETKARWAAWRKELFPEGESEGDSPMLPEGMRASVSYDSVAGCYVARCTVGAALLTQTGDTRTEALRKLRAEAAELIGKVV